MKWLKRSPLPIRSGIASLGLAVLLSFGYAPLVVAFGDVPTIQTDSAINLTEKPGDAPYSSLSIEMTASGDEATLLVVKDDERTELAMDLPTYTNLFQSLLDQGAAELDDQVAGPNLPISPGQSRFELMIREGTESHSWTADGVDELRIPSAYRNIVGQIIAVAERVMSGNDDNDIVIP